LDKKSFLHKRVNILVVDDNPELMQDILLEYGYNVIIAYDGLEAQEKLQNDHEKYDIVLLDILMSEMNGWEVLKFIRDDKVYKHIPVIIITALNNEIDHVSGLKVGADDYIVKPFNISTLIVRIEALLRRTAWNNNDSKVNNNENKITKDLLTTREREIMNLVAEGDSNKKIAEKLFLSELTVKTHLKNIFKKMSVSNRTQAILTAINKGMVSKRHMVE